MWGINFPTRDPFVYSIFGIQYLADTPDEPQQSLISTFDNLIVPSATHVDKITQVNSSSTSPSQGKTQIWLAYWSSTNEYQTWWTRPDVVQFWASLPPDAGMYRETLTVPRSRTQFGTNKQDPVMGLGHLSPGPYVSVLDKSGYWGCYRHRIPEITPENRLQSPLAQPPTASRPACSSTGSTIRSGRVKMTGFPENICFVVEGQDHSRITPEEKDYWFENFDGPVTQWIEDLVSAGSEEGVLDARICYDPQSGMFRDGLPEVLNYCRKVQLFYFLDFGYMLQIGMRNKGHVNLRRKFLKSYGPDGDMSEKGEIYLWVETSILKSGDIDCEYVGCTEGTGLLAFEGAFGNNGSS